MCYQVTLKTLLFWAVSLALLGFAMFALSGYGTDDSDDWSRIEGNVVLRDAQSNLCRKVKIYIYDLPAHIQPNLALSDVSGHQYKYSNSQAQKQYAEFGYGEAFEVALCAIHLCGSNV